MTHILLVEDDRSLAKGIRYALQREGWQVTVAHTLTEARGEFAATIFDLYLLDVMLPDGDGFELCQHIRKRSASPVIFLTACDEEVNVVQGLDLGADDYITKPFRLRELISRIRANLRRHQDFQQGQLSKRFVDGDILLDIGSRQVCKNQEQVFLTPMEFKLLQVLTANCNQVLTREQILDKLWDSDGNFVDDNTLSVHIRRLRSKIEDNPSEPEHIITVRGIGYKWVKGDG